LIAIAIVVRAPQLFVPRLSVYYPSIRWSARMRKFHSYRFDFIGHDGRIARSTDADCVDDEQASSLAIEMFNEQDQHRDIEVWDRARMVFRYP
jgi:hypothetical protein